MRLSPRKIDTLSAVIYRALEENPEVQIVESPADVRGLIRRVIEEDLRAEVEIEEEARKLLEENLSEIQLRSANFDTLLRKAKAKLAQDRKMVL